MFLLCIIIFLCGAQSIQPMDISEQGIELLIAENHRVLSSSGIQDSQQIEALLKLNQIAIESTQIAIGSLQPALDRQSLMHDYEALQGKFATQSDILLSQGSMSELSLLQNQQYQIPMHSLMADHVISNQSDLRSDQEYREALAFFNIQDQSVQDLDNQQDQIPTQHSTSAQPFPHSLEDYLKPLRFYQEAGKRHPLIEDGFLIEIINSNEKQCLKYSFIETYLKTKKHYQCIQCQKTFDNFNEAQNHSSSLHLRVKFKCDRCDFHATDRSKISKHMRNSHATCCKETFTSKAALALHLEKLKRNHNPHIKIAL